MEEINSVEEKPIINSDKAGNKSKIMMIIMILILVASAAGLYFLYDALQTANNERDQAISDLAVVQEENAQLEVSLKVARDTKRKKDLTLLGYVINDYNDSINGNLTTEGTESKRIYDKTLSKQIEDFKDPSSGNVYGFVGVAQVHTPPPLELGEFQYQWLGKCAANGDFEDTASEKFTAIRTVLESGKTYCLDI